MATMNVSLPDLMREWVESQIEQGEYASSSDYIRDLIRQDQRRQKLLKAALNEGLNSGRSPRSVDDIMREVMDEDWNI
ncbi:type II toxin-antitoxin system ParD family antitoxin [Thalassospira profundimaris]|uniref:type II toxin-antitoxin system ParD family antitoxin n=1 Tax=Thalassospira profundimaris TaxID=502049 RepID=UPI0002873616|nr:type II toxin-antitoxin system ParD family antitoxin [Thalassospira profundimaris]EKF06279.1 addiction module antidote protein [Thalassospira profundimaris WP0211]